MSFLGRKQKTPKYVLVVYKRFDVESQCRANRCDIFTRQFLENGRLASIIESSDTVNTRQSALAMSGRTGTESSFLGPFVYFFE